MSLLDKKITDMTNRELVRSYFIHGYLYDQGKSIMADSTWDWLCNILYNKRQALKGSLADLIDFDSLSTSSTIAIPFDKIPKAIFDEARDLRREYNSFIGDNNETL